MDLKTDTLVWKGLSILLAAVVLVAFVPGIAVAQTGIGGAIVVEEGQTVSSVEGVGGTITIHGTVTGDVSGAAGTVLVTGTVEGDVNVAAGSLEIAGDVGGDVASGTGSFHLREGGSIGGNLDIGAGDARIDGTIGGDAQIGAETIRLGETASIAGSLTYDGDLQGNLDAVAGEITHDPTLSGTILPNLQPLASWAAAAYAFVANLVLGAILLVLFPRFSRGVADRVRDDPVRTGAAGLGVLIGVPILLLLLTLTIVGIPLMLGGALLFVFLAWIALVYGRFAVGAWLVSLFAAEDTDRIAGVDRRWVALVVGLLVIPVIAQLPYLGWLINLGVFVLGLGAVAWGLYARRSEARSKPEAAEPA